MVSLKTGDYCKLFIECIVLTGHLKAFLAVCAVCFPRLCKENYVQKNRIGEKLFFSAVILSKEQGAGFLVGFFLSKDQTSMVAFQSFQSLT